MKEKKTEERRWLEGELSLQEVSKILGLPTSTLRYWDKEGLVTFERNQQNDYRLISLSTLLELINVLECREMNVPIAQIKQVRQMTTDEILTLLDQNRTKMQAKIAELQQTLSKINLKEQAIHRLKTLEQRKPTLVYRQLPSIYKVDLSNRDDIRKYFTPMQNADILYANGANYWMAGMWAENANGKILRPADMQAMPYFNGLLRFELEKKKKTENNADLFSFVRGMGYRPQYIIYQYLATARNPKYGLCSYNEYWMAVTKE